MPDIFSRHKRSQLMSKVRCRGNKATELRLVSIFKKYRITGWRRHLKLPGTPDFAFPKRRLAVFTDGCFWHGCPRHYNTLAATVRSGKRSSQRTRPGIAGSIAFYARKAGASCGFGNTTSQSGAKRAFGGFKPLQTHRARPRRNPRPRTASRFSGNADRERVVKGSGLEKDISENEAVAQIALCF
jgi:DNA mismatch endonuclease Vsr